MAGDLILVIDDYLDIRESIAMALSLEGYRVVTASNGLDALNKLYGGLRPCLIILDMMMPVMNGFAFRQSQLEDPELAKIPLIAYSAVTDPNETAQHLRADAYLYKPTDLSEIIAIVQQFCQKKGAGTAD
jgi:CheY-like chemotaxis protein